MHLDKLLSEIKREYTTFAPANLYKGSYEIVAWYARCDVLNPPILGTYLMNGSNIHVLHI